MDDRKQGGNVALIDTQTVPVDHCLYLCVYECVQPCVGASSRPQEVSWVLKHIFVVANNITTTSVSVRDVSVTKKYFFPSTYIGNRHLYISGSFCFS